MKSSRFINIIILTVLFSFGALIYVHQEVEIVKTSVLINKNRQRVTLLLDQYRSLVYNLSRLEAPKRIEDTLSLNEITLCMLEKGNIQRFQRPEAAEAEIEEELKPRISFLARMFDRFSTKAEAKVIKD